jgi:hypothetical protein
MARSSASCCQSRTVSSACAVSRISSADRLQLQPLHLGNEQRREKVIADGLQFAVHRGLFTAGPVSGTVFVTATSVADPSVVGVAQVTIGTPPAVLPASVSLLLQATRSNTSAACTPAVGNGGQVSRVGPLLPFSSDTRAKK